MTWEESSFLQVFHFFPSLPFLHESIQNFPQNSRSTKWPRQSHPEEYTEFLFQQTCMYFIIKFHVAPTVSSWIAQWTPGLLGVNFLGNHSPQNRMIRGIWGQNILLWYNSIVSKTGGLIWKSTMVETHGGSRAYAKISTICIALWKRERTPRYRPL